MPESGSDKHIVKALEQLRKARSVPAHRESTKYDLIYKGERYPPKYVLYLANKFVAPGNERLRSFRGGRLTNDFLESSGFKVVPKNRTTADHSKPERRYWVVSPNVTDNHRTIDLWKQAITGHNAAFMGWGPDNPKHKLGIKFAKDISKDDVILIGRRLNGKPDVVGWGVVSMHESVKVLKGFAPPDSKWIDGTIRKLSNFIVFDGAFPAGLPIMSVFNHTQSLRELHPTRNSDHRKVCVWLTKKLGLPTVQSGHSNGDSTPKSTQVVVRRKPHRDPAQFDFLQRSAAATRKAMKLEADLVKEYKKWLGKNRVVEQLLFDRFACDAYEKARNNLIEAKSSSGREYIRMAVGQLLDYAFLGEKILVTPNLAILLRRKPGPEILKWLDSLNISVIWKQRKTFSDNKGGLFT